MLHSDFTLKALYNALDEQRRTRSLSWKEVAEQVNRTCTFMRPIAISTITSLKEKKVGEGDGILQMLLWLRRTPESFVPGMNDPGSEEFCHLKLATGQILRWNTKAIFAALNEQRNKLSLSWNDLAEELGRGFTPNTLKHLSKGGRTGFPHVMRFVQWLGKPAATFTRVSKW